jgi:hypothetical protein
MAPDFRSPSEIFEDVDGETISSVTEKGVMGTIMAFFAAVIIGLQTVAQFVISPITAFIGAMGELVDAFVTDPLMVIPVAAEMSAQEISIFGFLALPAGVALVLVTFAIIGVYLRWEPSSDFLPGTRFDLPTDTLGADEDER